MPFVPGALLAAAVEGLRGKHPLGVVVLPAMLRAGVHEVDNPADGVAYGAGEESALLDAHFRVAGAPKGQPYRAVWETDPNKHWRDERYPGRTLQRMRTDRVKAGRAFFQQKQSPQDLWGLRPTAGPDLAAEGDGYPIRLVDMAIWFGRNEDAGDLDGLVEWFRGNFPLDQAGLLGSVFSEDVPAHYRQLPLASSPLEQPEYAEILGSAPAPPQFAAEAPGLAAALEKTATAAGFVSSPGLIGRIASGWLRGDLVVLVGQPGTGKTRLATLLEAGLRTLLDGGLVSVWLPIHPEFDDAELIGYERLDGSPQLGELAQRILMTEDPLSPHLIVLEEFNLATAEAYLSPLLVALQDPERRVGLPNRETAHLPVDTFVLATCNSYLDEPETRRRLSFPTKRRSTVITMPNVLAEQFDAHGPSTLITLAIEMVKAELGAVEERRVDGLATTFDAVRGHAFASVSTSEDLSHEARATLEHLGEILLSTPEGRQFFTMGILRDISVSLALAPRTASDELRALGAAIADKVIHQMRGPKERASAIEALADDLPNRAEIVELLDRMRSAPGDELVPLL